MDKGDLYKLKCDNKNFTRGQLVKFIYSTWSGSYMVEDVNDADNFGWVYHIDLEKVVPQEEGQPEKVVHPEEWVLKSLKKCATLT